MNEIPVVGMAATMGCGSDRYPGTVIQVKNKGRTVVVQADTYKPGPGHVHIAHEVWEYERNLNGSTTTYTLRQNGRWVRKGENQYRGSGLGLGHREHHYDPHV